LVAKGLLLYLPKGVSTFKVQSAVISTPFAPQNKTNQIWISTGLNYKIYCSKPSLFA
jgi:hypothetical protein